MSDAAFLPTVHSSLLAARTQIDNAIASLEYGTLVDLSEGGEVQRKLAAFDDMLEALKNIQRASKLQDAGNFTMELRAALQIASAAITKAEGKA